MLAEAYKWIVTRGWFLSIMLVVVWPLLSIPAGKFTKDYFAFWVLISIAWGFGAAIVITFLPLMESATELSAVFNGIIGRGDSGAKAYVEKDADEKFDEA